MKNLFFNCIDKIQIFFKNNSGATAIEYGLVASLVGIGMLVSARSLGFQLGDTFECIADAIDGTFCTNTLSSGDASKGWAAGIPVKAGRTYEITVPPNFKFTIWNDAHRWMNADTNSSEHSLNGTPVGLAAIVSDNPLSKPHVSVGGIGGSDNFNNYSNTAVFKNGKITITAQKDGFLNAGIIDSNSSDNWTTTDGGVTKSRNIPMTITRVR